MEEVAMRAQAAGGIGMGGPPSPEAPGQMPQSPMEMNANTEEFGTAEGAEPTGEEY